MKLAILYPGQGSQTIGMGLDIFEQNNLGQEVFKTVDKILNRKISDIFLYGPEEELNQTRNTQVAIVTISIALTLILQDELKRKNLTLNPTATCGHSLGEFSSIWLLNILSLEEIIKLVSLRGNLMQSSPPGVMAAILNLNFEKIKTLLDEKEVENKIVIANHNSPSQYVISGEKELFQNLLEKIKALGGRAIILPVSGAFHSPLMNEPSKQFNNEIDKLFISSNKEITIPIYQNWDGKPYTNYHSIKENLKKQMTSSVLWTQTINNLVNDGVNTIVEIGPGKILTGLVKKINPSIECFNIFDLNSLQEFVANYESKCIRK